MTKVILRWCEALCLAIGFGINEQIDGDLKEMGYER